MAYLTVASTLIALLAGGASDGADGLPTPPPARGLDTGYENGFFLRSRNGDQQLTIGGLVQMRAHYNGPERTPMTEFVLNRARLELVGRFEDRFVFALEPRFGADEFELEEAWLGIELGERKDLLRVGRIKVPFGLEEVRSRRHIPFAQFSILSQFFPAEQHGLSYGVEDGLWEYSAAIYNGSGPEEADDGKELALRAMVRPFAKGGARSLRNLSIGAGVTLGREDRDAAGEGIENAMGLPLMTFAPGTRVDGNDRRVGLEFAWYDGPNMIQSDLLFTRETLTLGGGRGSFDTHGGYVSFQHVLSGEDISFKGPKIAAKRRGTWVAATRLSYLGLDPLYRESGVVAGDQDPESITTVWAGMNYYFNEHVLLRNSVVYSHYGRDLRVEGERVSGEPALLFELQLHF